MYGGIGLSRFNCKQYYYTTSTRSLFDAIYLIITIRYLEICSNSLKALITKLWSCRWKNLMETYCCQNVREPKTCTFYNQCISFCFQLRCSDCPELWRCYRISVDRQRFCIIHGLEWNLPEFDSQKPMLGVEDVFVPYFYWRFNVNIKLSAFVFKFLYSKVLYPATSLG